MKNIGLIFDTGDNTGAGHFWRCFNLALLIKKKNRNFFFISKKLNSFYKKLLKKHKFNYVIIKNYNLITELQKIIYKFKLKILITDLYILKTENKKKLRKNLEKLIVIDDFYKKKHYADALINNNSMDKFQKKVIKKLNPNTKLFLGKNYFICSKELKIRKKESEKNTNIFVFFGSSDPTNETGKFLEASKTLNKIKFKLLIGNLNKNYSKIKKICRTRSNIKLIYNIDNNKVINIMRGCKFAIGSAGINLTERLYLRIPSITICTAINQKAPLMNLKKKKLVYHLGYHNRVSSKNILNSIKLLNNNRNLLYKIKSKIKKEYIIENTSKNIKNKINILIN